MILTKGESLKISSNTQNITLVERVIDDVCEQFKVNEDRYGNILIAVTEAVNNAIQHGNHNNPEKNVTIEYNVDDESVTFSILDEGSGFDYQNLPDPTAPENIDKINGRGIFLMKNLSDKIEFDKNGKQVLLKFNFN
ncbi:MAG: ATP-binding protein [Bacteroidia bacterium]|nr:ATP-binding protein [Bacteroidia bacterium]